MSALSRARERLARRQKNLKKAREQVAYLKQRVANTKATIASLTATKQVWHPDAERVPYTDGGSYRRGDVPARGVLHTTQGTSLPRYSGSAPHFTFFPKTGRLVQHIATNRCALSLEHPAGTVETNHAHAIQIELVGFAETTQDWSDAEYARIARLMRWVEANAGVKRACSVTFTGSNVPPKRLSASAWLAYAGWLGHQHVPSNHHWDPGKVDPRRLGL